jgi:coronin-7
LIATTSKDKKCKIIDPRSQKLITEFVPIETERDCRVLWINPSRVLTCGFGSGGRRCVSLWYIEDPKKPLKTEDLVRSNCFPIPHYDEDTNVLWIANSGSAMVQMYRISPSPPYIEMLNEYKSMADTTGHAFVHKTSVDVKKVEVARSLKLSKDKIIPISWTLPRKRLEFFQDDIFPPTRSVAPVMSLSEWMSGENKEPELVSLQPSGMIELSKAPKQELTDRQIKYQKNLMAKEAPKPKGILGHTSTEEVRDHFRNISKELPTGNRWDAKADPNSKDVDDAEWAD